MHNHSMKTAIMTISLTLAMLSAPVAVAHKGASGVVKQRMKAMTRMEKALRPLNAMEKGKREFDSATLRAAAEKLLDEAQRIPELFPAGSLKPPSEASEEIWKNFPSFTGHARQLRDNLLRLRTVDEFDFPQALQAVRLSCKKCHERFRIEKE